MKSWFLVNRQYSLVWTLHSYHIHGGFAADKERDLSVALVTEKLSFFHLW